MQAPAARELSQVKWTARAFGTRPADVDRDIHHGDPSTSIDVLLRACLSDREGRGPDASLVSAWTVARRLDWLIAIRLADGTTTERIPAACSECHAQFELEVDLPACRVEPSDAEVEFAATDGGKRVARLPTGADHARWHRESTPLSSAAASLLEGTDVQTLDEAATAALESALALRDPMRELSFEAACPECGRPDTHVINLEQQLLRAFSAMQRRLLGDIDTLARAYHWGEAEIASMPAWRRAFYIHRIEA